MTFKMTYNDVHATCANYLHDIITVWMLDKTTMLKCPIQMHLSLWCSLTSAERNISQSFYGTRVMHRIELPMSLVFNLLPLLF